MRLTNLCSALVCSALLATAVDADACGGLFCSASSPVNQAAERIIFAQDGDTVHAVIEIQYAGPSENFAWVLPVPGGVPVEVGVSSKQALDALQQQSNPTYTLTTTFEDCNFTAADAGVPLPGSGSGGAGSFEPSPDDSGVEVVVSGTVGPYDYAQLAVDESLPNVVDVITNWLEENGYDVANLGIDRLETYLESGLDLIAFRLTKGTDTGSIRPIALSWSADYPVIPIRPTAVAANPDMGVMVWVLGPARAIPTNYFHLELNEAKINWFNPGPTYNNVVIAAADEAGGQGFVTEQSTNADAFRSALLPEFLETEFTELRTGSFTSIQSFLESAVRFGTLEDPYGYTSEPYDGFLETLSDPDLLPLREGATPEQFLACVYCYFEADVPVRNDRYPSTPYDAATDPLNAMNVPAFLDGLEVNVVKPLRDTQALFEPGLTATRFYTTLSPDEMTVDPAFDFNPDLEPVSNVHTAERYVRCDGTQRVTLPQGFAVEAANGSTWPVTVEDDLPLNYRVLQLSLSGLGDIVIDNEERIVDKLTELDIGGIPDDVPAADDDVPAADDDVTAADDDVTAADDDVVIADDDGPTGGDDDLPASDDDVTADDDVSSDDDVPAADDTPPGDDTVADDDAPPAPDVPTPGAVPSVDAGADDDTVIDSDDGCGCTVPGSSAPPNGLAWLAAVPLALALLRRRGRQPSRGMSRNRSTSAKGM
jgi:MYXO-CTERM domain-containing protein